MVDTVADVLLAGLREWDVRHVFGYPGDGINGLLAVWGRAGNDPEFIQARHEELAAFETVGYAKFSGRVAVCAATSGPGAPPTSRRSTCSLLKYVCSDYVQMCTVPQEAQQ